MNLSILCVTQGKQRTVPFLDHFYQLGDRLGAEVVVLIDGVNVHSRGYLESCLDEAAAKTSREWILRLDDDEKVSPAMADWLERQDWDTHEETLYSFPRVHFWGDEHTIIADMYYFPDLQTRLTRRDSFSRDDRLHSGNPRGAGTIAKVCLEHWCYLVKDREERRGIAANYHSIKHGADGGEYRASCFEEEGRRDIQFMEYNAGTVPMKGRMWRGTYENWRKPNYIVHVGI